MRFDRSRALLARLSAVESPDVTFVGERFPVVLKKGKGLRVSDVDGNRYVDFTACFGVLALGHRSATTLNAMRRQSARLIHGMGDVHPTESKVRLLELLAKVTPFSQARTVLSLSGGEAVESALKTAMLVTGRHRFVSFSGGYHGLQFGPLSLNDRPHFTRGFEPWLAHGHVSVPVPIDHSTQACEPSIPAAHELAERHGLTSTDEALTRLEDALKPRDKAGLVFEPVQGRAGERLFPPGFLAAAAALARKYGTLLIADEIFTGLGRTGPLFGCERHGISPDLLCLGKALGGGLPLSACVGDLLEVWGKSAGEARHTSTYLGHPLACAVAHDTVQAIIERLASFQDAARRIDDELACFARKAAQGELAGRVPFRVRGAGHMRGIWFHASADGFAVKLAERLLCEGFLVLPSGARGDVLALTPPLIADGADFKSLLQTLQKLLVEHVTQV